MTDPARCATLRHYAILDTAAEPAFDLLAMEAAEALRTRHAVVSFLDDRRQWYKARFGIRATEVGIASSFCTHAIRGDAVMVVPDARADGRFAGSPMVLGPPHVRFYAAATIRAPNGVRIGTVCVFDPHPRAVTTDREKQLLATLAARTVDLLEVRRPAAPGLDQPSSRALCS